MGCEAFGNLIQTTVQSFFVAALLFGNLQHGSTTEITLQDLKNKALISLVHFWGKRVWVKVSVSMWDGGDCMRARARWREGMEGV
jgi:hypothetical protein